jgi:hypothetical protein
VSTDVEARDRGGAVVARTHSDSAGHYEVAIGPGPYTMVAVTDGRYPSCQPTETTVVAGRRSRADIQCDTGIR